jgi:hypothetical protein
LEGLNNHGQCLAFEIVANQSQVMGRQ